MIAGERTGLAAGAPAAGGAEKEGYSIRADGRLTALEPLTKAALGVGIEQCDRSAGQGAGNRDMGGDGSLARSTLLLGKGNDQSGHQRALLPLS